MDVIRNIQSFNAEREPERLIIKYRNMRLNPFVFLRGTCHLFYDRLPREQVLDQAPLTWLCGDLHIENFGSYKGDNRLVYFDINDFDEAVLSPCSWDLVRCLSSILAGAKSMGIKRVAALALCQRFLDGYVAALKNGKARWVERDTADGLIRKLLDNQRNQLRPQFLDSRTERKGKQRLIRVDGKKALPVNDKQRSKIITFMDSFASKQPNPEFFQVRDVARRIAGTGSLGVERYIILVEGKGSPDRNYLLDLKQALPSSLSSHLFVKQPDWQTEAHRIVALQQRMQAVPMAFLQPVKIGKKSYVLRGLQPSEDRVTLNGAQQPHLLDGVILTMGELVAWSQLRSSGRNNSAITDMLIDFAQKKKWQQVLMDIAEQCTLQVVQDWKVYAEAFDDGVFAS
ncbi:DUF2252 domain-containing protein [Sulfuriferula nivalis]|uniref:DUF2252 domain-containing protein n=1 Tax=Sulfuriferula nivalis TaxID=2675298 RepID=A0A809SHI7_9PROT|nr:DUF2252 domain-containing protein [Sulfuriferula nivalis]BBP00840.1 hypothetical protein SFSGTM_15480 [Sulfuriferula nivalis]